MLPFDERTVTHAIISSAGLSPQSLGRRLFHRAFQTGGPRVRSGSDQDQPILGRHSRQDLNMRRPPQVEKAFSPASEV